MSDPGDGFRAFLDRLVAQVEALREVVQTGATALGSVFEMVKRHEQRLDRLEAWMKEHDEAKP